MLLGGVQDLFMSGNVALSSMTDGIFPEAALARITGFSRRESPLSERSVGILVSTALHAIIGAALFFSGAFPTWTEEVPIKVSFVEFVPVDVTSSMPSPSVAQEGLALKTAVTKSPPPKSREVERTVTTTAVKKNESTAGQTSSDDLHVSTSDTAKARLGAFEASAAGIDGAARTGPLRVGYESAVLARLERVKRYPSRALQRHLQGEVMLALRLNPDGTVLSSAISRTSGFDFFDNEVLKMVERATPFPAAPSGLQVAALDFVVPIAFRLQ
ncbi:MAG: hypothetical protein RL417_734 [Pseudomonadota bacterium]|jgi:protein TonB